jgi:hypothetical protein
MIKQHVRRSNIGVLVGVVLTLGAYFTVKPQESLNTTVVIQHVMIAIGAVCFVWGCQQYALAKGRSPHWGWLGFGHLIGLIILVCIPQKVARTGAAEGGPGLLPELGAKAVPRPPDASVVRRKAFPLWITVLVVVLVVGALFAGWRLLPYGSKAVATDYEARHICFSYDEATRTEEGDLAVHTLVRNAGPRTITRLRCRARISSSDTWRTVEILRHGQTVPANGGALRFAFVFDGASVASGATDVRVETQIVELELAP